MDNDFVNFVSVVLLAGSLFIVGFTTGQTSGGNQKVIYCIEKPEQCKIEYQYFKLGEGK